MNKIDYNKELKKFGDMLDGVDEKILPMSFLPMSSYKEYNNIKNDKFKQFEMINDTFGNVYDDNQEEEDENLGDGSELQERIKLIYEILDLVPNSNQLLESVNNEIKAIYETLSNEKHLYWYYFQKKQACCKLDLLLRNVAEAYHETKKGAFGEGEMSEGDDNLFYVKLTEYCMKYGQQWKAKNNTFFYSMQKILNSGLSKIEELDKIGVIDDAYEYIKTIQDNIATFDSAYGKNVSSSHLRKRAVAIRASKDLQIKLDELRKTEMKLRYLRGKLDEILEVMCGEIDQIDESDFDYKTNNEVEASMAYLEGIAGYSNKCLTYFMNLYKDYEKCVNDYVEQREEIQEFVTSLRKVGENDNIFFNETGYLLFAEMREKRELYKEKQKNFQQKCFYQAHRRKKEKYKEFTSKYKPVTFSKHIPNAYNNGSAAYNKRMKRSGVQVTKLPKNNNKVLLNSIQNNNKINNNNIYLAPKQFTFGTNNDYLKQNNNILYKKIDVKSSNTSLKQYKKGKNSYKYKY